MITANHIHPNRRIKIAPFRKDFSWDFVPDALLFRRVSPDTGLECRYGCKGKT
jgi:hypothetical protein